MDVCRRGLIVFVCFYLLLGVLGGFSFLYFNTSNAILFSIPLARLRTKESNTKDPSILMGIVILT